MPRPATAGVADVFAPLGFGALGRSLPHRDVRREMLRRGTVPVLPRRRVHRAARAHDDQLAAPGPGVSDPPGDVECLPHRVGVPRDPTRVEASGPREGSAVVRPGREGAARRAEPPSRIPSRPAQENGRENRFAARAGATRNRGAAAGYEIERKRRAWFRASVRKQHYACGECPSRTLPDTFGSYLATSVGKTPEISSTGVVRTQAAISSPTMADARRDSVCAIGDRRHRVVVPP